MKDDNKVHATDTLKNLGEDVSHGKEGIKDMKATMQADYEQTKEDVHGLHHKMKGDSDSSDMSEEE